MEINPNFTEKAQRDYKLVCLAVKKGNQKAYAELMKYYRDSIYFMLLKMTNNVDDADDLTIEAFGKAFKNLHQYTPDYAFSTWLFKIASNNCIDYIRKKKKETIISIDKPAGEDRFSDMADKISENTPDPEEIMILDQKAKLMHEVVEKLKPRYKKLVELRYFKELSYEEISEKLNLPIGTVKAQLFRARELLYNILKSSQEKI